MNQLEESYLMHYGVKMRSGRYAYGSGKRPHQHDKKFRDAVRSVKRDLDNSYQPFKEEPVNIQSVKSRSGLSDREAIACVDLAEKKFREAKKHEPKITRDVVSTVVKAGGNMYGLKNRLKQPSSIAGKIGSDSKDKGISLQDASKGIRDTIRYTAVSNDKDFVNNYNKIIKDLDKKGYTETKCKNYFDLYSKGVVKHKAVQSNFRNKDGVEFELQFQTPASQAAKELKIPIYEERRKQGISPKRAIELERKMEELAESVPNPPDVMKIRSK